jgi:protein SCO1/2
MEKAIFYIMLPFLFVGMIMIRCENSATQETEVENLPIIGKIDKATGERVDHQIRPFSFMNQDSQVVTNATFKDKIYVADFFFIHCPTICPKVTANMKRIHDTFADNDTLSLISYSIDTRHDTIPALKNYAEKLGVEAPKWHFATGKKSEIYAIAEDYHSSAKEDEEAPGGFDHSGYLILVDKEGHVRSFARGTEAETTDRLMEDIRKLLAEYR